MESASLYKLAKKDIPRAVKCLKDAFKDDPLWAEVFKDDPDKDQALSGFYTCPLLYGMRYGKVYAASPDIEGVAAWVQGKYADMSTWGMLRSGALSYGMKMGKESIRNLGIVSKQLGPERKNLMDGKPYLYLTIIGVSSGSQGKGFGSRIMDAINEECKSEGFSLYLETEKEENISFYEKHGLTILKEIKLDKLNLPMWLMVGSPSY